MYIELSGQWVSLCFLIHSPYSDFTEATTSSCTYIRISDNRLIAGLVLSFVCVCVCIHTQESCNGTLVTFTTRYMMQQGFYECCSKQLTIALRKEDSGSYLVIEQVGGKSVRCCNKLQKQQPNQNQPHAIHQIQQSLVSQLNGS